MEAQPLCAPYQHHFPQPPHLPQSDNSLPAPQHLTSNDLSPTQAHVDQGDSSYTYATRSYEESRITKPPPDTNYPSRSFQPPEPGIAAPQAPSEAPHK